MPSKLNKIFAIILAGVVSTLSVLLLLCPGMLNQTKVSHNSCSQIAGISAPAPMSATPLACLGDHAALFQTVTPFISTAYLFLDLVILAFCLTILGQTLARQKNKSIPPDILRRLKLVKNFLQFQFKFVRWLSLTNSLPKTSLTRVA